MAEAPSSTPSGKEEEQAAPACTVPPLGVCNVIFQTPGPKVPCTLGPTAACERDPGRRGGGHLSVHIRSSEYGAAPLLSKYTNEVRQSGVRVCRDETSNCSMWVRDMLARDYVLHLLYVPRSVTSDPVLKSLGPVLCSLASLCVC